MDVVKKIKSRTWIKLWDFHFPIWLLDVLMNAHINYNNRLGYENKNTIHVYSHRSEEAYFSGEEIELLKPERRRKLLSRVYMQSHERGARKALKKIQKLPDDFFAYARVLEGLLSYYRASRPEVFEVIEDVLDDARIKKLVRIYGHLRFELKKAWFKAEKEAASLKTRHAKSIGLNLQQFEQLTNDEIILLTKGKLSKSKAIKLGQERNRLCIFGLLGGKKFLVTGAQARAIASIVKEDVQDTEVIKGKVANNGKVKGIVRIIPQKNYKKMIAAGSKFKKGEILVTGMTQPDILNACMKARAIITDEGGITSHAAIVSRELGIPCIIGTKIATKVLKDGDRVEVDAIRGIVRKIK